MGSLGRCQEKTGSGPTCGLASLRTLGRGVRVQEPQQVPPSVFNLALWPALPREMKFQMQQTLHSNPSHRNDSSGEVVVAASSYALCVRVSHCLPTPRPKRVARPTTRSCLGTSRRLLDRCSMCFLRSAARDLSVVGYHQRPSILPGLFRSLKLQDLLLRVVAQRHVLVSRSSL